MRAFMQNYLLAALRSAAPLCRLSSGKAVAERPAA